MVIVNENGKIPSSLLDDYINSDTLILSSNTHYKCANTITDVTGFNITDDLIDTSLIFNTGNTISGTINVASGMKINRPFEFAPNKSYIIAVNNHTILWDEIIDTTSNYTIDGNNITQEPTYLTVNEFAGVSGQFVKLSGTNILGNNFSLNGDVKLNGYSLNNPSGLVQLNQNGKIPSSSETDPIFVANSGQFLKFESNITSKLNFNFISNQSDYHTVIDLNRDSYHYNYHNCIYLMAEANNNCGIAEIEINKNNFIELRAGGIWDAGVQTYDDQNTLKLTSNNLLYNNHGLNTALGLVQLDQNGKIPSSSYNGFTQKTISINKPYSTDDESLYLHLEYSTDPTFTNNVNEIDTLFNLPNNVDIKIFDGFEFIDLPSGGLGNAFDGYTLNITIPDLNPNELTYIRYCWHLSNHYFKVGNETNFYYFDVNSNNYYQNDRTDRYIKIEKQGNNLIVKYQQYEDGDNRWNIIQEGIAYNGNLTNIVWSHGNHNNIQFFIGSQSDYASLTYPVFSEAGSGSGSNNSNISAPNEYEILIEDSELENGKNYICDNSEGLELTLPNGEGGKAIKISTKSLNENAVILINPAENETINDSETNLQINNSYSSVELVFNEETTSWDIVTPFIPYSPKSDRDTIISGEFTSYLYNANYLNGDIHNLNANTSGTILVTNLPVGESLLIRLNNANGNTIKFAGSTIINSSGNYYLSFINVIGTVELIGGAMES